MSSAGSVAAPGEVWVDAQLPPALADWLNEWGVRARHLADLGQLEATDEQVFDAARRVAAIVVTKDADFVRLLETRGAPPQVVWVTIGNVRNARLRAVVKRHWPAIQVQLAAGEPLVELADFGERES